MKKILIISFFFNQAEEIGSIRLRGLAKYLPKFGWQPTILTINSSSDTHFRTVETGYLDLKANWKAKIGLNPENTVENQLKVVKGKKSLDFLLGVWEEIFAYPDAQKNWYRPAIEAGSELLEHEHFDAMLSSSSPVTCHLIASELKKRYNVPWTADLRDLWTQNPYVNHTLLRKILEKRLELKTLKNADALTTTTEYCKNDLKQLHKKDNTYAILNGFDPVHESQNTPLTEKFNLVYTGRLYYGKRDPELLFQALTELINEEKINAENINVDFYGPSEPWLLNSVKKHHLENVVKICGVLPRNKVLKKQRESQVLLLLTWKNSKEKGVIPGKIFEYLAAKRPILSIGNSDGLVRGLIESTNTGVVPSSVEEIKSSILMFYNEFTCSGEVKYRGIPHEIDKYSQVKMAEKFSHVLNQAVNEKSS
jgi:glycosyltransferase involved in cell wall biosynthesis